MRPTRPRAQAVARGAHTVLEADAGGIWGRAGGRAADGATGRRGGGMEARLREVGPLGRLGRPHRFKEADHLWQPALGQLGTEGGRAVDRGGDLFGREEGVVIGTRAREEIVGDDGEGEDVDLRVVWQMRKDFGRHVPRGPRVTRHLLLLLQPLLPRAASISSGEVGGHVGIAVVARRLLLGLLLQIGLHAE